MKLRNVLMTLALLTGSVYGQQLKAVAYFAPPLGAGESVTAEVKASSTPASVQKYVFTQPHKMNITTPTPGAYICYSQASNPATDGKGGCKVGTLFTAAINVTFSRSIYAVANAPGHSDSPVAEAIFTFVKAKK